MMKKLLVATTALTFSAGFAAAEVTVGGFGYVGVVSSGGVTTVQQQVRLEFTGTTTTTAGTSFEAYVRLDVAGERERIQFVLGQRVFLRQHFRAGELVELYTGVAGGNSLAVGQAMIRFVTVNDIGADGHLAHAFHSASNHQVLGA